MLLPLKSYQQLSFIFTIRYYRVLGIRKERRFSITSPSLLESLLGCFFIERGSIIFNHLSSKYSFVFDTLNASPSFLLLRQLSKSGDLMRHCLSWST